MDFGQGGQANFVGQEGGFQAGQGIDMGGGMGGGFGQMPGQQGGFQAGGDFQGGMGLGGGFGQMFGGQGGQGGQFGAGQGQMGMGGGFNNQPMMQARQPMNYPAGQQQRGGMTIRPQGGGGGSYNPYSGAQQRYGSNPQANYQQYMNNYAQYANAAGQQYNNAYQNAMAKQQYQQNANAGVMAGKLYGQQQDQYNQAKQANIQRYNQTLQGYDTSRANATQGYQNAMKTAQAGYGAAKAEGMGYVDQMGKQETADTNMRYQALSNKTNQSAISSGLGNSTVLGAMQRGVSQDQSAELRRVNEGLLGQRLGVQSQYDTGNLNAQQGYTNAMLGSQQQFDTGKLNTMASRVDAYPDQQGMNQLAMQAGRAGVMPYGMNG